MGSRSVTVRPPQHTGEVVQVEPLGVFLRRDVWLTDGRAPARPTWRPSLEDYDHGRTEPEDEAT